MNIKEIEITGTNEKLQVRMLEKTEGTLEFSYGIAMKYEVGGESFTVWKNVATYTAEGGWGLIGKFNSEIGIEIVREFADTFKAEIVAWQTAKAMQKLVAGGTVTPAHIEFLYNEVAPVELR